jgi:Arc/MetJ family transcription regulator
VTKILVDVDDTVLADAMHVLGTKTKKDTVNAALREVTERHKRALAFRDFCAIYDRGGIDVEVLEKPSWYE